MLGNLAELKPGQYRAKRFADSKKQILYYPGRQIRRGRNASENKKQKHTHLKENQKTISRLYIVARGGGCNLLAFANAENKRKSAAKRRAAAKEKKKEA